MKPIILSIEGNIGSGKTTILEKLGEKLKDQNVVFLREPLNVWESIKDSSGENILQKFYADPSRYAFSFQVMAYSTRLSMIRNAIEKNPNCPVIICERSLEADKNIFAKMLRDEGSIEDINYQIYEKFYAEFSGQVALDGIVYIDADADVCKQRIVKRSRDGEEGIPLEYLEKCKKYHDDWLTDMTETPVLRIKTNQDVTYVDDEGLVWLNDIERFIQEQVKVRDEYLSWKYR